jgi:hypothetical protein
MSRSKRKRAFDVRRTVTPEGARVTVLSDGFELRLGLEIIALVRWSYVRTIFAYSRFIGERSNVCLHFDSGEEDQVAVDDSALGWGDIVSQLPAAFPSMDSGWLEKASRDRSAHVSLAGIVPAYTVNPVQVWPTGT